jgi:hypothetical protein
MSIECEVRENFIELRQGDSIITIPIDSTLQFRNFIEKVTR